jgi:type I restriction enzyme M protein
MLLPRLYEFYTLVYTLGYHMSEKITLNELKSHLWASANLLRGKIDSSDFKNYIFGLLFYKRLSDTFDEEHAKLTEKVGAQMAKQRDMYPHFYLPDNCSWKDVLAQSTDIGAKINNVFEQITRDNSPKLDGILDRIDFNDKEVLSDATLSELIQHFNKITLANQAISGDVLGQAYEYLIEQFADDAGKKGGEFYTPAMVVELLVMMLKPQELESVYDPCCGSGGMLVHAANNLKQNGKDPVKLFMYGQESNRNTFVIAKMNMFLHGYENAHIERGDTFLEPKHVENGQLKKFDIVLANPPWNQKNWSHEKGKSGDPYNRFGFGLPSKSSGDWAWLQLMYTSLKPGGRMGIVMDNGVLFRGSSEAKIRQQFLEEDLIEAVIGLPANLFYNTGSPGCLVLFNDNKPDNRKGKILVIDASKDYLDAKKQNFLRQEDIDKTAAAFDSFEAVERYCTVAGMEEIEENDFNLNISRYVDTTEPEEPVDIPEVLESLKNLESERKDVQSKLDDYLRELNL